MAVFSGYGNPLTPASSLRIVTGDITQIPADAIVNAANSRLLPGSGVCGAIYNVGGAAIFDECRQHVTAHGSCPPGSAVITGAGKLPSRHVIHAVGPVWEGGQKNEAKTLASCYFKALEIASANGCNSISFPAISTGVYGFPKELAATIAVQTVLRFLHHHELPQQVFFVCFDTKTPSYYKKH
ncbi:MAG TPA: macro domain-containing protein [Lacibacter sp.]|nr:macro domain-containing protein [Lacibacter sp.]HMO89867.1 macro domain-containing protein [Lacibacter sp.]